MYSLVQHLALLKQIVFIQQQMHVMVALTAIKVMVVVVVLLQQDAIMDLLIVIRVLKDIIYPVQVLALH